MPIGAYFLRINSHKGKEVYFFHAFLRFYCRNAHSAQSSQSQALQRVCTIVHDKRPAGGNVSPLHNVHFAFPRQSSKTGEPICKSPISWFKNAITNKRPLLHKHPSLLKRRPLPRNRLVGSERNQRSTGLRALSDPGSQLAPLSPMFFF